MKKSLFPLTLVFAALGAHAQALEVMHTWTSPSESASLRVIVEGYTAAGGTWIDSAVAGVGVLNKAVLTRLAAGNPPGAAQFLLGRRVQDAAAEGLLGDISDVATRDRWDKALPPAVLQAVTYKGKVVAVPVTLAGTNWVWYSPKVLKASGIEAPKTLDEMFASADKIQAAGYVPFAVGAQNWQLYITFGSLLLGTGGRQVYEQYARADPQVFSTPEAVKAMDYLLKLRALADAGSTNRSWNDTTNMVLTDRAAFQFMGDWAKGEFMSAGKKPGVDFGCMLTPGAQNMYLVMGDSFAMPAKVSAEAAAGQKKLAAVVMDPRNQRRFALTKGTVPARNDVSTVGFDDCAALAMKLMVDPKNVVAGSHMTHSSEVNGAITDALGKIWATKGIKSADALKMLASTVKSAQ